MRDPETRCVDIDASEIRMETDPDGRRVIRGVAIRYGSVSKLQKDAKGRVFRERFAPGAFSRAMSVGVDVRFLVNHNRDLILGRSTAGTLRLIDDPDALRYEAYPPSTVIADHYVSAVERRDMSGVSFRFYKIADRWSGLGEATVRDVLEADIDDLSIVTYPAYDDTSAATRSHDEYCRATARRDPWLDSAHVRLRLADSETKDL
jgi:HK97 family phage prohead protease